jgi:hypothetical protein
LSSNCEEDDKILDPVPPCFLSHLKWIGLDSFCVDKKFLSSLKILLNKAIVLETIVIFLLMSDYERSLDLQDKICEQLMELPAGPQNCKIVLEWFDSFPRIGRVILDVLE